MSTEKYKIYLPQGMKTSLTNDAELFEFYKPNGGVNLNGFLKTLLVNYFEVYSSQRSKLHSSVVTELIRATDIKKSRAEELATSILTLCKANNLKPYEYFKYLLEEIPKHGEFEDPAYLDDLLPWSDSLPDYCRKPEKSE